MTRVRAESMRARSGDGFTLVEFLVALSILGIVLGLISNSLGFGVRSADQVESSVSKAEERYLVQAALRRQIQLAQPSRRIDESGSDQIEFTAGRKAIEFVAPRAGLGEYESLYRIGLVILDDAGTGEGSGRLVMRHAIYLPSSDPNAVPPAYLERVVFEGFRVAEFAYFDSADPRGEWMTDWQNTGKLPELVRLRIDAEVGSEPVPDLIVAVKASSRDISGLE
jgi:general secretion pathway protein J